VHATQRSLSLPRNDRMYDREQVKAITDKVLDMASRADAAEVTFSGGERSGTRWANSSITTNLVQFERQVSVTVRVGQRQASAQTRDLSDEGLRDMIAEAFESAEKANEVPRFPEWLGPQEYIPVDAALPSVVNLGPAERARLVKTSLDIAESMGVMGAGFIPKTDIATCTANSLGLFAYYRAADVGFSLTCRLADGSGSGWSGISGVKDMAMLDAEALTKDAASKAVRSKGAKAIEPGRYTVILEPRASARFLSLVTGIFTQGRGGGPGGGAGASTGGAAAGGADSEASDGPAGGGGGGGGGGLFGAMGGAGQFMAGKKVGDKIFSDGFTLRSDIGNPILRQSPIGPGNRAAGPVTWLENGVLTTLGPGQAANTNQSLVQEGTELSVADMIRQTRRGLLVNSFWYIRGVPSLEQPLLNTGMTRDGLFLIENGEIVGPVQNFRWNMSPVVGYNNLSLVGQSVPMGTGEAFDAGNAALVPPVRIEEFYMTSISPAV
jgi:predicted Zn-dependent protease